MQRELRSDSTGMLCLACGRSVRVTVFSGVDGSAKVDLWKNNGGIQIYWADGWVVQELKNKLYVLCTGGAAAPLRLAMEEAVRQPWKEIFIPRMPWRE